MKLPMSVLPALVLLPLVAFAAPAARPGAADDLRAIDQLVQDLYASVSFPPGGGPDWEAFGALVRTDATFVQAERGSTPMKVMDMEGFRQDWRDFLTGTPVVERGFTESVVRHQTAVFGNIAHSFVVFEPRVGDGGDRAPVQGVDSVQLVKERGRWWIVSITTQFETRELKVPAHFGAIPATGK